MIKTNNPWAVIVVTPIMKRAQDMKCSREIIFIDSSSSVDTTNTTVTNILSPSKAGAIPLAILIHEGQTEESYIGALSLLKNNFPNCFGGIESPLVFMTDDSAAEKKALSKLWPKAKQFLCHFHMCQAEWRWLHDSKNGINLNNRLPLMKLFQLAMYSMSEEEFKNIESRIKNEAPTNFIKRFEKNCKRQDQWVHFYRSRILYRNHDTNNYAEASIRIMKDILLNRTKAYNVVALVDFIVSVGEEYFTLRILNHAHGRHSQTKRLYDKLCSKMIDFNISELKKINESTYASQV
ncbi:hypothetical protein ACI65C_005618 [Semiaphis heraclei]